MAENTQDQALQKSRGITLQETQTDIHIVENAEDLDIVENTEDLDIVENIEDRHCRKCRDRDGA